MRVIINCINARQGLGSTALGGHFAALPQSAAAYICRFMEDGRHRLRLYRARADRMRSEAARTGDETSRACLVAAARQWDGIAERLDRELTGYAGGIGDAAHD
jgi:hypothetical protein